MFGIFIINLRIYRVKECALNMVLLSRLFLHLTDLTPMQRFYVVVGVLAVVVFLQFLVIIVIISKHLSSKRSKHNFEQFANEPTPPPIEKYNPTYETDGDE